MSATHDHAPGALHDSLGVQRADPSGTLTLRRRYAAQFTKRYRRLKGLVYEATVRRDVLGLRESDAMGLAGNIPGPDDVPDAGLPETRPVAGGGMTIDEYMAWFDDTQGTLVSGPDVTGTDYQWSEKYVRYSYEKGMTDAERRAKRVGAIPSSVDSVVGVSFDLPIHKETLDTILARNRLGLDGVSDEVRKQVGRELTEGFLAGENPEKIARRINDRVDAIGMTRARTHARTVVMEAHAEASLNRYEQMLGSDAEVTAAVEFSTAGDNRVCPICQDLEGSTYSVSEARGIIPVHPNCRCAWLPVV